MIELYSNVTKHVNRQISESTSTPRYKQITDEENFESICVNFMFRELFPRMDIQLSPEIAIGLYYIMISYTCRTYEFTDNHIF